MGKLAPRYSFCLASRIYLHNSKLSNFEVFDSSRQNGEEMRYRSQEGAASMNAQKMERDWSLGDNSDIFNVISCINANGTMIVTDTELSPAGKLKYLSSRQSNREA